MLFRICCRALHKHRKQLTLANSLGTCLVAEKTKQNNTTATTTTTKTPNKQISCFKLYFARLGLSSFFPSNEKSKIYGSSLFFFFLFSETIKKAGQKYSRNKTIILTLTHKTTINTKIAQNKKYPNYPYKTLIFN